MEIIDKKRYDAFFSYAHDDAKTYDGWLRAFYDRLKETYPAEIQRRLDKHKSLKNVSNRQANFFWDKKGLPANGPVGDELKSAVETSEFLFVFIGIQYPKSIWCGKEVKWFVEHLKAQGKDDKEIYHRLFIILMEREALEASWGDGFLAKAKNKALYQSFVDEDGRPTTPWLQHNYQAIENPAFTESLRNVTETLVERTAEILSQVNISNQLPDSPLPPQKLRGVTIGAVNPNLEPAVSVLQTLLQGSDVPVETITLEDMNSQEADEQIKACLKNSAFFIQPFDYGKVSMPVFPGGHLCVQEESIKSAKITMQLAFWRVPPELGGIEETGDKAENREKHISYLANLSQSALRGSANDVARYIHSKITDGDVDPGAKLPTVFIENAKEDERVTRLLAEKLEQLWKSNYDEEPKLNCLPVPWRELKEAGETTLKKCHGVIMIYGTKSFDALLTQIIIFAKKLDPLSHSGISIGCAVAWAPPKTPREGTVGYTLNFDCVPMDDQLKVEEKNVKDFLKIVHDSFLGS